MKMYDYNVWEEEQIAQDREHDEGIDDEGIDEEGLADILLQYTGQAVQIVGESLATGKGVSPDLALKAIEELKHELVNVPEENIGEVETLIEELHKRFVAPEAEERSKDARIQEQMEEEKMYPSEPDLGDAFSSISKQTKIACVAWVRNNCKFASDTIISNAANIFKTNFIAAYKIVSKEIIKTAAEGIPSGFQLKPSPELPVNPVQTEFIVEYAMAQLKRNPIWQRMISLAQTLKEFGNISQKDLEMRILKPFEEVINQLEQQFKAKLDRNKLNNQILLDLNIHPKQLSAFKPGFPKQKI